LLEPRSFDTYKNTAALMIVMLDYSKVDIEVSDAGIKTMRSNDCRRVSGDNRDTNSVLATIQERVRFSYKDGWKFINPSTQSICYMLSPPFQKIHFWSDTILSIFNLQACLSLWLSSS